MLDLTLPDALALLFVSFAVVRSRSRPLGDSLHSLIALLLVIALFMGLRMAGEMRQLLGGLAEAMRAISGLGSRLLVIIGAWYLLRLLRKRSGYWIERAIPGSMHRRITPFSEGLRAALLAGFVAWLAEGWYTNSRQDTPLIVHGVRIGDAWVARMVNESSRPAGPQSGIWAAPASR